MTTRILKLYACPTCRRGDLAPLPHGQWRCRHCHCHHPTPALMVIERPYRPEDEDSFFDERPR
ncbi:MAG: hypothetical protein ACFCBW_04730 [Candidatus Competibacterales bacterium]